MSITNRSDRVSTYLSVYVFAVLSAIDNAYHQKIGAQDAKAEQQNQGSPHQFSRTWTSPCGLGCAATPTTAVAQRWCQQDCLFVFHHHRSSFAHFAMWLRCWISKGDAQRGIRVPLEARVLHAFLNARRNHLHSIKRYYMPYHYFVRMWTCVCVCVSVIAIPMESWYPPDCSMRKWIFNAILKLL